MRLAFLLGLMLSVVGAAAEEAAYRLVENWAQLPAGTKWATMTAVDIDAQGTIYVFQRGAPAKVMAFDPTGKLLRSWGDGTFPNAHGLRVDRAGNVWVTDRGLHQVLKFSPEGKLLLALGKKGVAGNNESTDALNGPSDVVIAPDGTIFVSDGESSNSRVVKFSADGKLIKFWGTKGSAPGQLEVPHSIVMDSKGRLFVANRTNKRVEMFDQDGGYIGVLNNVGTPYGLFMTKDDVLYAVDGDQGKDDLTMVDTKTGKVVGHFGGMVGPHMVAVDAQGAIYVAETRGASVKKWVRAGGTTSMAAPALQPIFNGRDLAGWNVVPAPNLHWHVAQGVLVGESDPKLTGSMLWTDKSYRDFLLELEGRWTGEEIDTGVRIRKEPSLEMQVGVSRSLKIDMTGSFLTDGQGHPTRYPEAGRAKDWQRYYKPGEWNAYRIEARGTQFTIAINGHEVARYGEDRYAAPSPIGLQFHDTLKMRLEFRNIRLAELTP